MKPMRNYYVKCPPIVKRREWRAKGRVVGLKPLVAPLQNIIVNFFKSTSNCLATNSCLKHVKEIQKKHIEEDKLGDIAYNFVIGAKLDIYEGRGWDVAPDDTLPKYHLQQNKIDILVLESCLVNQPISGVMNLVTRLVRYGVFKEIIEKRHRVYILRSDDFPIE